MDEFAKRQNWFLRGFNPGTQDQNELNLMNAERNRVRKTVVPLVKEQSTLLLIKYFAKFCICENKHENFEKPISDEGNYLKKYGKRVMERFGTKNSMEINRLKRSLRDDSDVEFFRYFKGFSAPENFKHVTPDDKELRIKQVNRSLLDLSERGLKRDDFGIIKEDYMMGEPGDF